MRILFIDLSTGLKQISDLDRGACGGRVNSLFMVSDYLAWAGHKVTVLSDIKNTGATTHGTVWDNEAYGEYDCLITNRGIGDGYPQIKAKSRILWTHDLPHSGFIPEPQNIRGFNATVFMSKYAERIWRAYYKDIGRSVRIPNGVAVIFKPRHKIGGLIYASAPNRGLDRLPLIHESLQEKLGREVHMLAYSHMGTLHPTEGDGFDYDAIKESTVDWRYPVPRDAIAKELGQALGLVLPTGYPEICSNIVLQALRCGTPVFTTGGLGATPEWVKHRKNGFLTQFRVEDYVIHSIEMIRNLVEYMESPKLQAKMQKAAAKTKIYSWKEIGAKWQKLIRSCA